MDNEQKTTDVVEEKTVQEEHKESGLDNLDSKELVSMIKELRAEAKSHRLAKSEAQKKLEAIEAKENKAKEEDLKKKGEYEKLLAEKESLIEGLSKKAKAFDEYYESEVNSIKQTLGENWEDEFANLSLTALKKLGSTFTKSSEKKIEVDNPNNSSKKSINIELNDEDKKEAEFMFANFDNVDEMYDAYKKIKLKKQEIEKRKKET